MYFVGVRGLEPPASTSRTWRASQLRYTPNKQVGKDSAFSSKSATFVLIYEDSPQVGLL